MPRFERTNNPSPTRLFGRKLDGKTVAIVHPAWSSCGTYRVICAQALAYRALGARVLSIALMDAPTAQAPRGKRWRKYLSETHDLPVDERYFSGPPTRSLASLSLLKDGWWPLIHGDQASWLIELVERTPLPNGLDDEAIDLVHANHFFTLPFVRRLVGKRRAPVVLETHDVQASQFLLRNRDGFFISPQIGFDALLAIELEWMRTADICVHLNYEECELFERLLPQMRHALVYPAVPPAAQSRRSERIIAVASGHYPNYLGIKWLLEEVLPLAPQVSIDIVGDIDQVIKARDKRLYDAYRHLFLGRVPEIEWVYERAACVLLPTLGGFGLSIRTVEALSSGAPLIATPLAFRGLNVDLQEIRNVTVAADAPSFAAAMRHVHARSSCGDGVTPNCTSDTRRFFDRVFGFDAYVEALSGIAAEMLVA
ncbi:glycosyltransferase [Methylosinus sp. sav-2]|uniref:glycosyltransferase n=1 Tax=Methylosinus sp. sav-2 TaxID=2485168 RepID=UPI000A815A5B|nr:glycosyltransferase [Methylosinus sp. sav-2]